NQYRLLYTVRSVDPEVLPGNLVVVVYLRDAAGNIGQPYSDVEPNNLAIYTALPSAVLSGTQTICQGDDAVLTVSLTGRSPWKIYLNDGSGNTEYANISSSPFEIVVNPLVNTTYTVDSVLDVNGTMNNGTGTAQVTVRQKTEAEIINLNSTYFVEADPVLLEANPQGGIFSGPGVNSAQGIFDPGVADTIDSPHTIYYTYTNIYGCVSIDSALVFVLGAKGDLFIPKSIYCGSDEPFTVSASNTADVIGNFNLYSSDDQEIPAITDNGDNTATIDPSILTDGDYYVMYRYFDEILFELKETFSVESPQLPEILVPDQDEYCQNIGAILLESSVDGAVFEGPGVSGDVLEGFVFDPRQTSGGEVTITLTNTSENGCISSTSKTLNILSVPEINFSVDRLCVSNRDTVFFTNTTANKSVFDSWYWDFGDPESGDNDTSTLVAPWHVYDEAGLRNIVVIGETTSGCIDTLERTIDFGDNPTGSFSWDNECFSEGVEISFTSEMESINDFETYEWTIIDPDIGNITKTGSEMQHSFDNMDSYTIRLYAETVIGCSKTVERKINLKPTITITPADNYTETFTGGNGWWSAEQADTSDHLSWRYNEVNFANMNGQQSYGWFTDLPEAPLHEYSWVKSPCFDFSDSGRPMISMDIYRSMERNLEGVILQATTDGGKTWQSVGNVDDGLNWYNSSDIQFKPGGDSIGWTGEEPFQADNGWVNARHDLGDLAGEEKVQFRVAFSTDNSSELEEREGFAFDDVMIGNKNRKVLIEHFTNSSSPDTREPAGEINSIYNINYEDAVKLEYHTSFPGSDPFNNHNSAVPATRAFYYGVTSVPYAILDGGYLDELNFDYSPQRLANSDVSKQSLRDATFDIEINTVYNSGEVNVEVVVSALKNLNAAERIIHVVVYEKLISDVPTVNGATNFLNVVKNMLPNSAGTAVFDGWFRDQTKIYQYSWEFENVYNPEMIRVAAFIQNDGTKEVYQVASDDTTNLTTSDRSLDIQTPEIKLYPNPASDQLYINIEPGNAAPMDYQVEIYDQLGRMVMTNTLFDNQTRHSLDVNNLARGVYFVRVKGENGVVLRAEKVVLVR
ncbi:MAG: T9SS type A sorting domain-containing protein, partial [Bacteroidales bacterium]